VSALLCVTACGMLDAAPVSRLDSDLLSPCRGVCRAMICCCGKGEVDDHETKWEVLRNI